MKLYQRILRKLFLLLFLAVGFNVNSVMAEDDLEYWSAYTFNIKLSDKLYFKVNPQFRIKDDVSDFYYFETVQGFKHKTHKNLELGLYYLYSEEDKSDGSTDKENRLRVEATLKKPWGKFKFSDRNRYEYRDINGKPKSRYRNRIKIERDVVLWEHKITPYIANEFFIDFRDDEFNQNRGAIGFSKKIRENVKIDISYLLKSKRSGSDWNETHVIGTSLSIDL